MGGAVVCHRMVMTAGGRSHFGDEHPPRRGPAQAPVQGTAANDLDYLERFVASVVSRIHASKPIPRARAAALYGCASMLSCASPRRPRAQSCACEARVRAHSCACAARARAALAAAPPAAFKCSLTSAVSAADSPFVVAFILPSSQEGSLYL